MKTKITTLIFTIFLLLTINAQEDIDCNQVYALAFANILDIKDEGSYDKSYSKYFESDNFRNEVNKSTKLKKGNGNLKLNVFGLFKGSIGGGGNKDVTEEQQIAWSRKVKDEFKKKDVGTWLRENYSSSLSDEIRKIIADSWNECNSKKTSIYTLKLKLQNELEKIKLENEGNKDLYSFKLKKLKIEAKQKGLTFETENIGTDGARGFLIRLDYKPYDLQNPRRTVKIMGIESKGLDYNKEYIKSEFDSKILKFTRKPNEDFIEVLIKTDLSEIYYYIDFTTIPKKKP